MTKAALVISSLLWVCSLKAQPPKGPADQGMTFGITTTSEGAVKADELTTLVKGKEGVDLKVTGKVVEVCKSEGCWIRMETANGPMLIKMKDHSFFVPLSLEGKTIVADGTATLKETSVEMLRHYAEDAGKSKKEIADIKEPKKEITIQAKGILVL